MIETAGDTDETRASRAEMVAALVRDGELVDERLRQAFLRVPRHVFVPEFYDTDGARIGNQSQRERWLHQVYSDATLVTQRRHGTPTSSGTMPSLVAQMLHALEVEDGNRVLQVATGTGYTAALLCERVGSANVTSIDVEPELTQAARERLRRRGYHPLLVTGDGNLGHSPRRPYDRCVATFGVSRVPRAWVDQTRTGGVIVAPVCSGLAHLTITSAGHARGTFTGSAYFIRHRQPAGSVSWETGPAPLAEYPRWPERTSDLPSSIYHDGRFRFFLTFTLPGLAFGYVNGDPNELRFITPDGSHAHISQDGRVAEFGHRQVWDEIETLHRGWHTLGEPAHGQFGITVSGDRQHIWLDKADSDYRWDL